MSETGLQINQKTGEIIESSPKVDIHVIVTELQKYMKPKTARLFNGKRHAEIDDLCYIARYFGWHYKTGETVYQELGNFKGFKAKAYVMNDKNEVVSEAESSCMNDESFWKSASLSKLQGMAQTRAASRALSNLLKPVLQLAGIATTPGEDVQTTPQTTTDYMPKKKETFDMEKKNVPYVPDEEIPFGNAPKKGTISDKQRKFLFFRWTNAGFDEPSLRKHLQSKYGTEHTSELTTTQLNDIIKMLDGLKDESTNS